MQSRSILPVFFRLDGVLYSMPVYDILTAIVSAVVVISTYKQLSQKDGTDFAKTNV